MSVQVDEPIKSADCNQATLDDNFMCIMRTDNSTIVSSNGVTVTGIPLGRASEMKQKEKVL